MAQAQGSSSSSPQPQAGPTRSPPPAEVEKRSKFFSPEVTSYFIGTGGILDGGVSSANDAFGAAGGCAGAASRTVAGTAKNIGPTIQRRLAQPCAYVRRTSRLPFDSLQRQFSAVQFTTYEQLKKWFTKRGSKELDTPKRLASGALAGITSVCALQLLNLRGGSLNMNRLNIPTRPCPVSAVNSHCISTSGTESISSNTLVGLEQRARIGVSHLRSLRHGVHEVGADHLGHDPQDHARRRRGQGPVSGLVTTAVGVAPYVGINFAAYEFLRGIVTPPGKSSVARKLMCGALAGSISQTLTYPFDVLRRKMQVTGMASNALGIKYNGALDALAGIVRTEGVKGLYRGLWPNLRMFSVASCMFSRLIGLLRF
ncbi:mitochondrial carrier domain-containing protein [Salix suchowensis]|nr:mitochondrial carrier domain-containing protein [Salix suchowensis]